MNLRAAPMFPLYLHCIHVLDDFQGEQALLPSTVDRIPPRGRTLRSIKYKNLI